MGVSGCMQVMLVAPTSSEGARCRWTKVGADSRAIVASLNINLLHQKNANGREDNWEDYERWNGQ